MYYSEPIDRLLLYQKLIQYWSILFDRRNELEILDNVNFSRQLFPQAIDVAAVLGSLPFEPGYSSPDASAELGTLVKKLERTRLGGTTMATKMVDDCGVGIGNGISNVIYNLLRAIARRSTSPHVVLALPNYPVYYSQLSTLPGIKATMVRGQEENGFLPTLREIENACTDHTQSVVLTFPNNPAQYTYEGSLLTELEGIVEFCQRRKIFLIADNIYEDTLFGRDHSAQNIFRLSKNRSPDYLLRVYGPSKDTPFFSGYRFGYWIGDRSLQEDYRTLISSTENCLNSLTIILASLFLTFKRIALEGREPQLQDMLDLKNGNFGWSVTPREEDLFDRVIQLRWYENYSRAMKTTNEIQKAALDKVRAFLATSPVFGTTLNGNLGNLILTGVRPEFFHGSGNDLFNALVAGPKVGVLPGDVFAVEKLRDDSTAFRITLVHAEVDSIVRRLEKIESYFLHANPKRRTERLSI